MSYKVKYVSISLSPHCDMYLPDKHNTDIRCLKLRVVYTQITECT